MKIFGFLNVLDVNMTQNQSDSEFSYHVSSSNFLCLKCNDLMWSYSHMRTLPRLTRIWISQRRLWSTRTLVNPTIIAKEEEADLVLMGIVLVSLAKDMASHNINLIVILRAKGQYVRFVEGLVIMQSSVTTCSITIIKLLRHSLPDVCLGIRIVTLIMELQPKSLHPPPNCK